MLEMRGITKSFDGTQALRGVDFSADGGEVHAIVGENGAGKSTLVKILAGAILRDAGDILLDGVPAEASTPLAAHRLGIRAVYQEFSLVPHLTVAENILLGQMPSSRIPGCVDWGQAYRRADEILRSIGFVGIDVRSVVRRMSVSHQQMVEIAKAVAVRPRILILDEPSAVLSQEELDRLFALVRLLREQGTLILYISHRLDEVFEIADRITVIIIQRHISFFERLCSGDGVIAGTAVQPVAAQAAEDDIVGVGFRICIFRELVVHGIPGWVV